MFGSECDIPDSFIKRVVADTNVVDMVTGFARMRMMSEQDKTRKKTDKGGIRGIPKLDDANWAGGPHSSQCTLIVTEGDSAKVRVINLIVVQFE